jgi:hypothetical protein
MTTGIIYTWLISREIYGANHITVRRKEVIQGVVARVEILDISLIHSATIIANSR